MPEPSKEEKAQRLRERVELAYAIKQAYGGIYPYDALRDITKKDETGLSVADRVAMKRGYKPSTLQRN
jgi:hypothetical protein